MSDHNGKIGRHSSGSSQNISLGECTVYDMFTQRGVRYTNTGLI